MLDQARQQIDVRRAPAGTAVITPRATRLVRAETPARPSARPARRSPAAATLADIRSRAVIVPSRAAAAAAPADARDAALRAGAAGARCRARPARPAHAGTTGTSACTSARASRSRRLTALEREVMLGGRRARGHRRRRQASVPAAARADRRDAGVLRRARPPPAEPSTRSSGSSSATSSREPRSTAAPSGCCARRDSWWRPSARSSGVSPTRARSTSTRCGSACSTRRPGPGFTHVVVTVGDRTADPSGGLFAADFDLLMRLPGVEAIDIVATREQLASGLHERLDGLIPGLEEIDADGDRESRVPGGAGGGVARPSTSPAATARRNCARSPVGSRSGPPRRTGPRARPCGGRLQAARCRTSTWPATVFEAAGIEYQAADALPLAAEPMAAVLDLVFAAVESRFSRTRPRSRCCGRRTFEPTDGERTALAGRDRRVRPRSGGGALPGRSRGPRAPGRRVDGPWRRGGAGGGGARAVR